MSHYQVSLGGLVVLCAVLFAFQPTRRQALEQQGGSRKLASRDDEHPELLWYQAYGLATAADWLQGPYLFSLYRDEYGLAPGLVSSLFMTDFISTAISAYFIGALSDKHGRKSLCMVYCLSYAVSCFLTIVPVTPLLFLGRILGGISTTILFTVFDSWMVTNFRERKLADDGCNLTRTYATTGVVNSLAAIMSGLAGEVLVRATGTKKSPFLLSVVLLWAALQVIWSRWTENYGVNVSPKPVRTPAHQSLRSVFRRPTILALVFVSTMFEGSMYLFVFYWVPTLSSVQKSSGELPYGVIFSSFMASSMAAALAYNIIMHKQIIKHTRLLVGILLISDFCFIKLTGPKTEDTAFWLFCLFEACVGMYGACIGYLKGRLIEDEGRTKIYGVMRIPLNIFVVVALWMARDSDNFGKVFSTCSIMLTASFATMWVVILRGMP
ncbi:DUF791-domain-containing protein [Xylariaceae sp. FL1651]|nr:DUF791-domain-containing protein [Xylariaceae sp. FL1651]